MSVTNAATLSHNSSVSLPRNSFDHWINSEPPHEFWTTVSRHANARLGHSDLDSTRISSTHSSNHYIAITTAYMAAIKSISKLSSLQAPMFRHMSELNIPNRGQYVLFVSILIP